MACVKLVQRLRERERELIGSYSYINNVFDLVSEYRDLKKEKRVQEKKEMTTKSDDDEHRVAKKREREKLSNESNKRSKKEDPLLEAVKASLKNEKELENVLWRERRKRRLEESPC